MDTFPSFFASLYEDDYEDDLSYLKMVGENLGVLHDELTKDFLDWPDDSLEDLNEDLYPLP